METPYFEQLCSEIRGFDLGDDTELLARLQVHVGGPGDGDADAWTLLAVLHHRQGDGIDALAAIDRAIASGASTSAAAFLRAHLLAALGRVQEADDALAEAEGLATIDDQVGEADLLHARGALLMLRGKDEQALVLLREALAIDPHEPARWVAAGRLATQLGQLDEADAAFTAALTEDDGCIDASYELASNLLARGRTPEAVAAMARVFAREPGLRERAQLDPRWRRERSVPTVAALLHPVPIDPAWLPTAPAWLIALGRDSGLAALGVRWHSRTEAETIAREARARFDRGPAGTIHTEATLALASDLLRQAIPVASGPELRGRDRSVCRMQWWFDPSRAQQLWLALDEAMPPFLWLPCGTTLPELARRVNEATARTPGGRCGLPAGVRGFIGYRLEFGVPDPDTGRIVRANANELDRYFAANPFMDPGAWGSAHTDDPWPDEIPAQRELALQLAARERLMCAQGRGRVWSLSRRTRWSRSILTIELHHRDVFVLDVRYQPADHGAVVDRVNAHFGCDYPRDLPVDVVAALLGFRFDGARDLEAELATAESGQLIASLLQVISALRHSDLGAVVHYRRFMMHPDPAVRSTLYNILLAHNHESLLEEASATEPDDPLRLQIEAVLDDGITPTSWEPRNDHERSTLVEEPRP